MQAKSNVSVKSEIKIITNDKIKKYSKLYNNLKLTQIFISSLSKDNKSWLSHSKVIKIHNNMVMP